MKRRERAYSADLQRLVDAVALYARQQWERVAAGGEEEYDEVQRDNKHVVNRVLPVIEQMLDEDLLEQLDRGPSFAAFPFASMLDPSTSPLAPWKLPSVPWGFWGGWPGAPRGGRLGLSTREVRSTYRLSGETRTTVLLDQILDDFRNDFMERLRKARRDDRALNDADLDELVKGLREELNLVARRSKHRKERKEENE